jgi:hypothetical protein
MTKRLYQLAAAFALAAIACCVVAYLRRHHLNFDNFGIEGAYFNRSVGAPAYAGVFSGKGNALSPFHPLDSYLWLGAGIAFALSGLAVAVAGRRAARLHL